MTQPGGSNKVISEDFSLNELPSTRCYSVWPNISHVVAKRIVAVENCTYSKTAFLTLPFEFG